MYFQYGSYKHPDNTVDMTSLTAQRMYSPRNRVTFIRWTLHCQGHFCVSGQDDIKDQLDEFEDAYDMKSDEDAGLYHDDGGESAHVLKAQKSINGVRVVAIKYPSREAEYASGRSFAITFQAEYATSWEDTIYSFQETLQMTGGTGPRWELRENYAGPPTPVVSAHQTVQHIVQQGKVVGLQAPPAIPNALVASNLEHLDKRMIVRGSAQKIGRNQNFLFPLQYRYVYSSVTSLFATPYPWPDYPGR